MTIKLHKIKSYYEVKTDNLTNHKIGELRKLTILDWIFRFRYSSLPVLKSLFPNVKGERIQELLNRMEKRKEIRKFALVTGFTRCGYCITESGFLFLQQNYYNRSFSHFFSETGSLTASNFVHDLAIQTMISMFKEQEQKRIGFANEWEIRRYFENSKSKLPDAIVEKTVGDSFLRVAIEVELSPKTSSRLRDSLLSAKNLITNDEVNAVLYLCPTNGLKRTVQRKINELQLPEPIFSVNTPETLKKLILGGK